MPSHSSFVPVHEDLIRHQRDYHDHHHSDLSDIVITLKEAVEVMENKNIPYALFGGMAGKEFGRPRLTHDIDFLVAQEHAEEILESLREKGFETERRDPNWIYKAWKHDILVDIIFRSCGDIYFEKEVREHCKRTDWEGISINLISPEDFIVIKCAAHRESHPHHWFDALAVLKQTNLDWKYLVHRARFCPRRVLSLLIYADAIDIKVSSQAINELYEVIYSQEIVCS